MRAVLLALLVLSVVALSYAGEFCPTRDRKECNTKRTNFPKFAHTMICPVANFTVAFGEANSQTSYLEGEIDAEYPGDYENIVDMFSAPWALRTSVDNPTVDEIQSACRQFRDMFASDSKVFMFESGDGRPVIISQDSRFGVDSSDTPFGFARNPSFAPKKSERDVGYDSDYFNAANSGYESPRLSITGQWLFSVCQDGPACTDVSVPRPLFGPKIGIHPEDFVANADAQDFIFDTFGSPFFLNGPAADHHNVILGARLQYACGGYNCQQGLNQTSFNQNTEDGSAQFQDSNFNEYTNFRDTFADPEQPIGISSAFVTAHDGSKILVLLMGGVSLHAGDFNAGHESYFLVWCVDEACSDWNIQEIALPSESHGNFNRGAASGGSLVAVGDTVYVAAPFDIGFTSSENQFQAAGSLYNFVFATATIGAVEDVMPEGFDWEGLGLPMGSGSGSGGSGSGGSGSDPTYTLDCGDASRACLGHYYFDITSQDVYLSTMRDDSSLQSGYGLTTNCDGDVFFFLLNGPDSRDYSPLSWYSYDGESLTLLRDDSPWPYRPSEEYGGISALPYHGGITYDTGSGAVWRRIFGEHFKVMESSNGQPIFSWADVGAGLGDSSAYSTWGVCGFHRSDADLEEPVCHTIMDSVELGMTGYVDSSFGKVLAATGPEGLPTFVFYFMHNGGYEEDARSDRENLRWEQAAYRDTPAPGQVTNRPMVVHCLDAMCESASVSSFVDERMADIVNWSDEAPTHLFHMMDYHADSAPFSNQVDIQRSTNPNINAHASFIGDQFVLTMNEGGYSNEHGGNPIRIWHSNRWTSPTGNPCSESNVGEKAIADGVVYLCTRVRIGSDNANLFVGTTARPWTRLYEWVDLSWGFGLRSLGGFLSFPRDESALFNTVSDLNPQYVDNWDTWLNQQPWLLIPNMYGQVLDTFVGPGKEDADLWKYLATYDSSVSGTAFVDPAQWQLYQSTYVGCRIALESGDIDMVKSVCGCGDNIVGSLSILGFNPTTSPGRCWPWLESLYKNFDINDRYVEHMLTSGEIWFDDLSNSLPAP